MRKRYTLLGILVLFGVLQLQAQDPHFSQLFNAPTLMNPALTGMMNTDARVSIQYRTQWGSLSTPYKTMFAAADFAPLRYVFNSDDIVGVGLYLLNDKAGTAELQNTQAQLALAYSKSLNGQGNNYLSVGGQVGFGQQRLNPSNLIFDSQIEGTFINTSLDNGETMDFSGFSYMDVSAGIAWSYKPEKFTSIYLGAAAAHLNEPQVSFFGDGSELLYRRLTAYAGGEFRVNYTLSLLPRAFYQKQGPHSELVMGALAKFKMTQSRGYKELSSLLLGMMYRTSDALILIARYDFNSFGVSFSYDVNVSTLNPVARGYGAMEVAVVYRTSFSSGNSYRNRPMSCPTF